MTRTVVHFLDSPTFGGTEQALLHLLAGLGRFEERLKCFQTALEQRNGDLLAKLLSDGKNARDALGCR